MAPNYGHNLSLQAGTQLTNCALSFTLSSLSTVAWAYLGYDPEHKHYVDVEKEALGDEPHSLQWHNKQAESKLTPLFLVNFILWASGNHTVPPGDMMALSIKC